MGELIRWRRPIFIGRWDFARWWVIAVFGKPLVKLPVPRGGRSRWQYLGRRSRWLEWPWVDFTASSEQWTLYVFNFTWVYRPERSDGR